MLTENQKIEAREIADLLLAGDVLIASENMRDALDPLTPFEVVEFRAAVHHFVCGGDGSKIPTM